MVGSMDSEDYIPHLPDSKETNAFPVNCWQQICLSKIWIPSHLLLNRKELSKDRTTQGIFHTLQKRNHDKCIESFSVYSDSEQEEEEIFLSDSEEDTFDIDDFNCKRSKETKKVSENRLDIKSINNSLEEKFNTYERKWSKYENCSKKYENVSSENVKELNTFSKLKSLPSLSNLCNIDEEKEQVNDPFEKLMNIRLNKFKSNDVSNEKGKNEVTQNQLELFSKFSKEDGDLKQNEGFINTDKTLTLNHEEKEKDSSVLLHDILDTTAQVGMQDFTFKLGDKCSSTQTLECKKKRNKKDKKKTKAVKSVTLDKFLEDYTEEDRQDDYCNDYIQKLLQPETNQGMQLRSITQFPNLANDRIKFIASGKSEIFDISFNSIEKSIIKPLDEINYQTADEYVTAEPTVHSSHGKIVIENIPLEVSQEDILSLMCGYGEIKDFTMDFDDGFLKALVEIDLCDIDIEWVTECLNGTEPFGASSRLLKCYHL